MDKVKFEPFEQICLANVNKGIYVWGSQGQYLCDINEAFIRNHETSTVNANRAIKLFNQRKDKYPNAQAFDCSGLLMYYLQNVCKVSSDRTADGIYKNLCTPISKSELKRGDMVFKGTASKKTHIGYVMSDGSIVSSRGRDYGVVANETGWKYFARFNYWIFEEPQPTYDAYPITRALKKGCKGEDVKALQKALNTFSWCLAEDGSFGAKTLTAVKGYQKAQGLAVDGSAGKATITSLYNTTGLVRWAK